MEIYIYCTRPMKKMPKNVSHHMRQGEIGHRKQAEQPVSTVSQHGHLELPETELEAI